MSENTNTTPATDTGDDRPPLWKQLLGAALGGGLALALYYGYETAKPTVTAYLTLPTVEGGRSYDLGAANIANDSLSERERKRIVSRNMRAAASIEGKEVDIEAIEDSSLDIEWPSVQERNAPVAAVVTDDMPEEDTDAEPMEDETDMEEDAWESLWSDMKEEEATGKDMKDTVHSEAPALPDSGFGAVFAIVGSSAGAAVMRIRKRKA